MATYSGTPNTAVPQSAIPAAWWNADVKGFIEAFGAWNPFTPTLSQGASTDITATKACEYIRINKTVWARYRLDITATGTAGSNVTVTLPVTASANGVDLGTASYIDGDSTDYIKQMAFAESTTTFTIFTASGKVGTSPAITVASGDTIWAHICYETA